MLHNHYWSLILTSPVVKSLCKSELGQNITYSMLKQNPPIKVDFKFKFFSTFICNNITTFKSMCGRKHQYQYKITTIWVVYISRIISKYVKISQTNLKQISKLISKKNVQNNRTNIKKKCQTEVKKTNKKINV